MRQLVSPLKRLLLQFLLLLLLYFLSRTAFTLINRSHFDGLGTAGFFRLAFHALRYDLSAICAVNALYIILLFLHVPVWKWPKWDRFTQLVFIISNSIALLFEIGDWAYYPYNFKRSTADVLRMVSRQGDFWSLLPNYIISYWYVPFAMVLFIFLFIRANNRIRRATPLAGAPAIRRVWLAPVLQTVLLIFILGATLIGIRGGLQYIPIGLRNAVQITDSRYVPIVLNTPFSIVTTLATPGLEEVTYLPDTRAARLMPFTHQYGGKTFNKKNVVVIILESGSKEFTALGGTNSYTPFLDSLMGIGFTCTQAFANGQTSAEGIPAIIAGIPTLMDEAFTTSNYGTNRITALPGTLKAQGYTSAFYHGGTNGTMSFDIFSDAAGYDEYYGRTEYKNEADYDGAWGIRDEPFLQYFAKGLSQMKQPFFASLFTIAAHPPYNLPDEYRNTLPKGSLPVHQCIAYTDMALRRFFATASQQSWYDSTLFIITSDHCSPQNAGGFYGKGLGQYTIPLVFYCPGDTALRGYYDRPVQQLDILPSTLQYLGYSKPFFAFGNSIFDSSESRFVITQASGSYQWLERGYVLQAAGVKPSAYYAYPADSIGRYNLLASAGSSKDSSLMRLQAFIQRYRHALIHNAMQ
jgi:arylsulfatase A-like enzyme